MQFPNQAINQRILSFSFQIFLQIPISLSSLIFFPLDATISSFKFLLRFSVSLRILSFFMSTDSFIFHVSAFTILPHWIGDNKLMNIQLFLYFLYDVAAIFYYAIMNDKQFIMSPINCIMLTVAILTYQISSDQIKFQSWLFDHK